jgi:DNA-directed RNA polymerase specialized sigma24 family protein
LRCAWSTGRIKHGGARDKVTLPESLEGTGPSAEELLSLNEVLARLERQDSTMTDVVKLRYFAGFTVPETARALNLSPRTVNRLWTAARAWLHDQIRP